MKTKEQAIEEAYGEHFEKCNPDENGWSLSDNSAFYPEIEFSPENHYYWRPKSLQGIENNNGWVKIESEEDLPKDLDGLYHLTHIDKQKFLPSESYFILEKLWRSKTITHYQPIKIPKPPHY